MNVVSDFPSPFLQPAYEKSLGRHDKIIHSFDFVYTYTHTHTQARPRERASTPVIVDKSYNWENEVRY
jgi:hypothetical protein